MAHLERRDLGRFHPGSAEGNAWCRDLTAPKVEVDYRNQGWGSISTEALQELCEATLGAGRSVFRLMPNAELNRVYQVSYDAFSVILKISPFWNHGGLAREQWVYAQFEKHGCTFHRPSVLAYWPDDNGFIPGHQPGRNICIQRTPQRTRLLHLKKPDILLRNSNIEQYMDNCLRPFLVRFPKKEMVMARALARNEQRIFINPFSSSAEKQLEAGLCLKIMEQVARLTKAQFFLSCGGGGEAEEEWIDRFQRTLQQRSMRALSDHVSFIRDSDMRDLLRRLGHLKVSMALSADTGVAHVLSLAGIRNITLYTMRFWDACSKLSLSAESVLGFCRFFLPQFPMVLSGREAPDDVVASITQALIGLSYYRSVWKACCDTEAADFTNTIRMKLAKTDELGLVSHLKWSKAYARLSRQRNCGSLRWLLKMYVPETLVAPLIATKQKGISRLLYSAWRNLPLLKLMELASAAKVNFQQRTSVLNRSKN